MTILQSHRVVSHLAVVKLGTLVHTLVRLLQHLLVLLSDEFCAGARCRLPQRKMVPAQVRIEIQI